MILLIDNYDSFTYNLYQYVGEISPDLMVVRNDKIIIEEIEELSPSHIIISPGPGFPNKAGISIDVVKHFYSSIPILGVCLGHQAIGEALGGEIIHAAHQIHGKASMVHLQDARIFQGLPNTIRAGRYHSLVIDRESLPKELSVIAETDTGDIMGITHEKYPIFGLQFHPESILTEYGKEMLKNFISINGSNFDGCREELSHKSVEYCLEV